MECTRQEAARLLNLQQVQHSGHMWPPRLVFKDPDLGSEQAAVFEHLYAGAFHSPATVQAWLSENIAQRNLSRVAAARDAEMGETPSASLRLVAVHGEGGKRHIMHMNRDIFLDLFRTMAVDEYALILYLTNVPGLHFLGQRATDTAGTPVFGFYLDTVDYTLIWSYDHRTRATNGVLIGKADGKCVTGELLDVVLATKDHILFSPLYLAFIACSHGLLNTWECDVEFIPGKDVVRLKTMELNLDSTADLLDFSEASLEFGKSLNSGERSLRILKALQSIANQLDHTHADSLWGEVESITGIASNNPADGKVRQSTSEIQAAMQFLQRQLGSSVAHFEAQI